MSWQDQADITEEEVLDLRREISGLKAEVGRRTADFETLRDEMKDIALALGRSQTDGESDCDWHDFSGEVGEVIAERDRYKAALERIAGYDFSAFAGILGPVELAKEALAEPPC